VTVCIFQIFQEHYASSTVVTERHVECVTFLVLQAETSRPSLVQIPEFFLIGPFGFKGTLLLEEKITVSQRVRKNLKCFISFWDENFTKLLYIIFVRIQKILLIIIFKNVLVLKHNFQIFLNRFLTDNIWREFVQWRHLLVHRSKEGHVVWSMLKRQCDKIFGCFSSISTWLCSYSSCYTIKVCITCRFFNPLTPPRDPEWISANLSQCWAYRHTWARIHFRFGKIYYLPRYLPPTIVRVRCSWFRSNPAARRTHDSVSYGNLL